MESVQSWIMYWSQVLATCLFWALEYYPIPTIIVGVLITGATAIGFYLRGQPAEVSTILWGSLFVLVGCVVIFLIFVIGVGPYLHLQQREKEITSDAKVAYETMEKSKNDQIKILNDTVAGLSGSQKALQEKEQMVKDLREQADQRAKENREKVIAKLCFHSSLAFTQTRLENFQAPSTIGYEYAREVHIKPFGSSGPTTLRIHVDGAVLWFQTTPRDEEFERSNGGVNGQDYVEVPVSSKVLEQKHWSIRLYGQKPFDVICIDRLPTKQLIPQKPQKEKLADVLIRKCPATRETHPALERPPKVFISEWLREIKTVIDNEMMKQELVSVMRARPNLRMHIPISAGGLATEALFTLRCLETEGSIRITETPDRVQTVPDRIIFNVTFEFLAEKLNEFKEGL